MNILHIAAAAVPLLFGHTHAAAQAERAATDTDAEIRSLQAEQNRMLDQLRREIAILQPVATAKQQPRDAARRKVLLTQLAAIEKRISRAQGERTRYVSPAAAEAPLLAYYDRIKRRIEATGTRVWPESGGKRLYGRVTLLLTLSSQGKVASVEVVRADTPVLAKRSVQLVDALAPFETFEKPVSAYADRLVLPLYFNYERDPSASAVQ